MDDCENVENNRNRGRRVPMDPISGGYIQGGSIGFRTKTGERPIIIKREFEMGSVIHSDGCRRTYSNYYLNRLGYQRSTINHQQNDIDART